MDARLIFGIVFIILTILVLFLNARYGMLRDDSTRLKKKPYSFARTQLTWWAVIIFSSFITVLFARGSILTFNDSALILVGISASTTVVARLTDLSDIIKISPERISQNEPGQNFLLDILSDHNGVSISRLQTVIFNFIIGAWFIYQMLNNLVTCPPFDMDSILPVIATKNMILLGLSSGTYAAMKTTENKSKVAK
jgi:hypothetical protein